MTAAAAAAVATEIAKGFRLLGMSMSDGESGRTLWESGEWGDDVFTRQLSAHLPKALLRCKVVSRELTFSSEAAIQKLRLTQRVFLHGECIEQWEFSFGFVIPGSTNSWQSTVEASDSGVIPAEILSGNTVIETTFYDGALFIASSSMRIFYDR